MNTPLAALARLTFVQKAALAVALLVASGWLYDVLRPAKPAVEDTTSLKARLESEQAKTQQWEQVATQQRTAQMALQEQLNQTATRLANVATQTHEVIYRYAPAPSGTAAPGPIINVLPAQPGQPGQPAAGGLAPTANGAPRPGTQPSEVIVRDTHTDDHSTSTTGSQQTTQQTASSQQNGTTTGHGSSQETTHTTETVDAQTSHKTGGAAGGAGDGGLLGLGGRLGVGVTSEGQPFGSLDVVQAPLGPRIFGLGKVGAGAFVTRGSDKVVDYGPQVNYGRGHAFLMGGYELRHRRAIAAVGVHF